jgi:hypothetical protein
MEESLLTRLYDLGPLCITTWHPLGDDEEHAAEELVVHHMIERKRDRAKITAKGAVRVQDEGWRPRDERAELAVLAAVSEAGGSIHGYVTAKPGPQSFIFCALLLQERGETTVTEVSSDLVYVGRIELTPAGRLRLGNYELARGIGRVK